MALGYGWARFAVVIIWSGGTTAMLLLGLLLDSDYWILAALMTGIALTVTIGLVFGWDVTRQDMVEELTGSEPGALDEESGSELARAVEAAENPGRVRDWPARERPN